MTDQIVRRKGVLVTTETMNEAITKALPESGTWTIDPDHTVILFRVSHLMAAKVRGTFKRFEGKVEVGQTPAESSIEVTIDAASIDTGVADRDNHLRSADF